MFEAAGWHTVMVKYGPLLQQRPELRARIDAMPNEEYQRLLRADAPELRTRIEVPVDDLGDDELLATFRDLGGHDLAGLLDGYRQADEVRDRPSVIFAYTIKGWSLPTMGHPANHSALLNHAQYAELAAKLGEDPEDPFKPLDRDSPEARLCAATGQRLKRGSTRAVAAPKVPRDLGRKHTGKASTQQAFGRFFVDLVREAPDVATRVVTVSPDVGHLDQPRRLDQQGGDLEHRRPDRLVRRRHRHARALARVRPRAALRARDRRGQPRRPARGAGRHLVARRPAAAADRDDLRPVRVARSGALVVRDLRRRAVDPRRHALRRHARPRGRRAPVGDHAVDRHRAAGLRRLRARVRPGLRVVLPARDVAARQAGRDERVLPALHAPDRPGAAHRHARGGARRRLQAAASTTRRTW